MTVWHFRPLPSLPKYRCEEAWDIIKRQTTLSLLESGLSQLPSEQLERVEVVLEQVEADEETVIEESELDEMWSYVGKKTNPRWL